MGSDTVRASARGAHRARAVRSRRRDHRRRGTLFVRAGAAHGGPGADPPDLLRDRERTATVGDRSTCRSSAPSYVRGQRTNPFSAALWSALARRDGRALPPAARRWPAAWRPLFTRLRRRRVFVTDLGGGGFDVSGYVSTDRWFHGHLHISEYSRMVAGHERNPRARVILGGVDTESSRRSRLPPTKACCSSGRLLPHKGVHDLIDAVAARRSAAHRRAGAGCRLRSTPCARGRRASA